MATLSSSSSSLSSTLSTNSDLTVTKATPIGSITNLMRKVRVVAKIRGFSDREAGFDKGGSWISVNKPNGEASESVTVSFGDQSASNKDSYELDYCYEQNEGNDLVFSREVKPLVSGVFEGCNATVFAYGAKSSGKTSVIQGSCEKPGLAALAMAEILSAAEESGKFVAISFFEVCQDRVYDLLDSSRKTVLVLEDNTGKVQLKGLSQVPVRSISDFQNLYVGQTSSKAPQKISIELPRRSHKGLTVYVSYPDEPLRTRKITFVDLAGYEDVRRKSTDGYNVSEQSKTNTSVYAFLNVIHALSTDTSRVPYRESKLARILKDSLGGRNKVLMITCLSPKFYQDSLYMVKLASRSSLKVPSVFSNSTKKILNLTRPKTVSIAKNQTPKTVNATTKKIAVSQCRMPLSEKKINGVLSSAVKGRKLCSEKSKSTSSNKEKRSSLVLDNLSVVTSLVDEENKTEIASSVLDNISVTPLVDEEVNSVVNVPGFEFALNNEKAFTDVPKQSEPTTTTEKDITMVVANELGEAATPSFDIRAKTNSCLGQEGQVTLPISARLKELSNNWKALCSATKFSLETMEDYKSDVLVPINDTVEPKTPMIDRSVTNENTSNYKNIITPLETPSAQGMKSSIATQVLNFLNTAEKEELIKVRGIGEKRATWICELREESPEPFKRVEDLKRIGIAGKQVKEMMRLDGPLFQ